MLLDNDQLIGILNLIKNPVSVHVGDEAVILYANEPMLAVWGKDNSIIGLPLEEGLPEMKGQPFKEMFATSYREGITYAGTETPADLVVDGKLGTYYFDFDYRAVRNANGEIIGVMNSAIDVTERVHHQQTLIKSQRDAAALQKEQEVNEKLAADKVKLESQIVLKAKEALDNAKRFERLVEQAPIAIAVMRSKELYVDIANANILEIWAKDSSIIGLPLSEAMPELIGQPFINILQNVISSAQPYYGQESKAFVMRNGVLTEGYFTFICQPLQDADGKVNSVLQVVTEVTAQVMSRLESLRTKEMMDMAIDAANLGSWQIDPTTKALKYNAALARIYGYQDEQPMTFDQAIAQVSDEHRTLLIEAIDKAIGSASAYDVTFTQRRFDDDQLIWLRSFGKINQDDSGRPVFTGFVMDVTEAKKDEQRKHDFIGIVSHELKTPLTSLNGYLQLLQRIAKREENNNAFDITSSAVRQLKRMNEMVNGFLDLSRLESGKVILDQSNFRLDELINEMAIESRIVDSSHQVEVLQCDEVEIFADRLKIASVLSNLLSNAAKYSPSSQLITVDCKLIDGQVKVCVHDKGIGISPEHIKHLFDRFYRVETGAQISGFGIGLYLSSEIISRHKGQIWAESELGNGSSFCFTLPLAKEI